MSLLAGNVRNAIDRGLTQGRTFVFPSQLAADFWKSDVLRRSDVTGVRVVRGDRFISWDTFKERTSESHEERAPANNALRRLAAHRLAVENSRTPFLSRIVPERFSDESTLFADYIRKGLTGLEALSTYGSSLEAALQSDVSALKDRYERILDAGGYFEPAWRPPSMHIGGTRYTVFFPSLIEDFEEFAPLFPANDGVEIVRLPERLDEHEVSVLEYEDTLIELRAAFDRIETLLEHGVSRHDIALTVGDLDGLRDELLREARRRGLPVGMRAGVRLSDHPAGRIFAKIGECVETGFHPDSVKKLVRHGAIPWLEPGQLHLIARFGVVHGCLGARDGKTAAAWHEAFAAGGGRAFREVVDREGSEIGELWKRFALLERTLSEIVHAPGFSELRTALYAFLHRFVDTGCWGSAIEPVFQRCMLLLSEWVQTAQRSGLTVDAPFNLFLASLGESIYVRPADRRGIPVYPYRVAAGTAPLHHIVIGASRSAITVPLSRLPFLREDEREQLESAEEPTAAFFRAYSDSGENVRISSPQRSISGAQIAPPGSLTAAGRSRGLFDREREAFAFSRGNETLTTLFPTKLYPVQLNGHARARERRHRRGTVANVSHGDLGRPSSDRRFRAFSGGDFDGLLDTLREDDGYLSVWPSTFEQYINAPFSYLVHALLGVEEQSWALALSDPPSEGTILHDLIRVGERALASEQVAYGSAEQDWLEERLSERIEERISREAVVRSPVPAALLRMQQSSFLMNALGVFEQLGRYFPDFIPRYQECTLSCRPLSSLVLSGRIDSLSASGDRTVILDFKRSGASIPSAQDIQDMLALQLPLYTLVAEENGYRVETAGYIAGRNSGSMRVAVGERPATMGKRSTVAVEAHEWEQYRQTLLGYISRVADRLRQLDFSCPNPKLGCDGCRTRAVCRSKYGHSERQV